MRESTMGEKAREMAPDQDGKIKAPPAVVLIVVV